MTMQGYATANCRKHENSCMQLKSKKAQKMLLGVITSSTLYKNANDYRLACDTYHTESFNNTLNIFQNKRIAFGERQYSVRAHLAILHWNTNVGRHHTSVYKAKDPKSPRSQKGKKCLVATNYDYRGKLWDDYISQYFN